VLGVLWEIESDQMRIFLVIVAERIQLTCVCSQTGATRNKLDCILH
jgi:hypothetical protein